MGNPDLQLRTDSLGVTPLLAPLSPLPHLRIAPQPIQPRKRLLSSGGSGDRFPRLTIEVAAFDCSSSNDSATSMTGRHDSKLIGEQDAQGIAIGLTMFHASYDVDMLLYSCDLHAA